jgi:hypothetical protein
VSSLGPLPGRLTSVGGVLALVAAVLTLTAVPAVAAPSITVSATTDLVDDQPLEVRGQGWSASSWVRVNQCVAGTNRCEFLNDGPIGSGGRFTVTVAADVVLDLADEAVDCRTSPCEVVASAEVGRIRARQAVSFDPAGPDPTRRMAAADPATDVVDGQYLSVTSADFRIPGFSQSRHAIFNLCREPVVSLADCDGYSQQSAQLEPGGALDAQLQAVAILHLDGPVTYDCRTGGCSLLARAGAVGHKDGVSEAAIIPLAFDPDAPLRPPVSGTATPTTDLVDDHAVQLDLLGFDPDADVTILQCVGPIPGVGHPGRCHLDRFRTVRADEAGELHRLVTVRVRLRNGGDTWDCRQRPCHLVLSQDGPARQIAFRLHFDPDADPLRPRVWMTPGSGLAPGQEVTLHGTGFRAWDQLVVHQCPSGARDRDRCDRRTRMRVRVGPPEPGGTAGEEWERPYRIRRMLRPAVGPPRNCLDLPCSVVVERQTLVNTAVAATPIRFARR